MAAPSSTAWGSVAGNEGGKIGIYTSLSSTNTQTTVTIQVWFWSNYTVTDTGNTVYFNNEATSATTSVGSASISHTSSTSWSTSNQTKIYETTKTYTRGTSNSTKNCAAKFTGIDAGRLSGATMTASTSYTIPALESYTIKYDANGGTGAPNNQTKYYGKALTLSSTKPTRIGYTFKNWNTASSGTGTSYSSEASYTSNASATLYAQWTANTYTIKYNANGGSGTMSDTTVTYNTATEIRDNSFTRTGYSFKGWHLKRKSDSKWLYTLSDGSKDWYTEGSQPSDANLTLYGNGSNSKTASAIDGDVITLYAQWTAYKLSIKYHINSGTINSSSYTVTSNIIYNSDGSDVIQSWNYNTGGSNGLVNASTFGLTKTGYTFTGWKVGSSGTTVFDQDDDTIVPTDLSNSISSGNATVTMYAVWTANTYKVTFNANGGTTSTANKSVTYDSTYGTLPTPTREGFSFNGWYTATSGGTKISSTTKVSITEAQTLYAQWTVYKLTVNYYSNYATAFDGAYDSLNTVNNNNVHIYTRIYDYDEVCSSGLINYTSSGSNLYMYRTGYNATGDWGTTTSGGKIVNQDTSFDTGQALAEALGKSIKTGDASVNIYAQWTPWVHTVSYNLNGGTSTAPSNQTKTYGSTITLSSSIPKRSGYTFVCWNTSIDETGTTYNPGQDYSYEQNGGTVILYAIWKHANVGWMKVDGEYNKYNTYVKIDGEWKPFIAYWKDENGIWRQGII